MGELILGENGGWYYILKQVQNIVEADCNSVLEFTVAFLISLGYSSSMLPSQFSLFM